MTTDASQRRGLEHVDSARLFQKSWKVYRAVLDNNDLCHHNLTDAIIGEMRRSGRKGPVTVLDLGCGDGHVPEAVFSQVDGVHMKTYTGVDASRQALDIAVSHVHADEVRAVEMELEEFLQQDDVGHFDVVLATFVIHHFSSEKKKQLIQRISKLLAPGGIFFYGDVYNHVPSTTREEVMARYEPRIKQFKGLSSEELTEVWNHVYEKDFPEEVSFMCDSMTDAGLQQVEILFKDDFYVCLVKGEKM
jgi:2-polyprenyl-3-methyl-5-hydroxy-6-metoxy-1,4-benzoquinol methylase